MKALGALIVALTRQRGAGELVAFGVKGGPSVHRPRVPYRYGVRQAFRYIYQRTKDVGIIRRLSMAYRTP